MKKIILASILIFSGCSQGVHDDYAASATKDDRLGLLQGEKAYPVIKIVGDKKATVSCFSGDTTVCVFKFDGQDLGLLQAEEAYPVMKIIGDKTANVT